MKKHLDIFLPRVEGPEAEMLKERLLTSTLVQDIFYVDGMRSSEALGRMAAQTEAPFVALVVKDTQLELGEGALERMVSVACDSGAAMVYADRYERKVESGWWIDIRLSITNWALSAMISTSARCGWYVATCYASGLANLQLHIIYMVDSTTCGST